MDAARLVREVRMAEESGDVSASMRKHRAALRAFPDIVRIGTLLYLDDGERRPILACKYKDPKI